MSGSNEAEIQRIIRTKCKYEILLVARDATEDDLKRSYKRIAVKTHPDKNPDVKAAAENAFKKLNEAFAVLSNPEKRAVYDRHGDKGLQNGLGEGGGRQYYNENAFHFHGGDDFDAFFSRIFEMHGMAGRQHYRQHNGNAQRAEQHRQASIFQLFLPVVLFVVMLFLYSFAPNMEEQRQSPFSLNSDASLGFTVRRKTSLHKIPYYVTRTFERDYARHLHRIEDMVYHEHKKYLDRRCRHERRRNQGADLTDLQPCADLQRMQRQYG